MTMHKPCGSIGILFGLAALFAAAPSISQQTVYRWVDQNGVVHYSDAKPSDAAKIQRIEVPAIRVQTKPAPATKNDSVATNAAPGATKPAGPAQPSSKDASPALPLTCFAASPDPASWTDLRDVRKDPPIVSVDRAALVNNLLRKMAGPWNGIETGFECNERNRARNGISGRVSASGRYDRDDEFVLDANVSRSNRSKRLLMRLGMRGPRFVYEREDALLTLVSDRALAFEYTLRIGGALSEYYWRIDVENDRLTVQTTVYGSEGLRAVTRLELTR